jgi:competence ComEA-like helix-hairpin-helix protein
MRKIILLFLFILFFLASNLSGLCNTGQIDINTASLEELDELYGIGPAKAQAIIDTRPFDSVDDLIDVYGIGDVTLDKIIDQGLACVSDEPESENAQDIQEDSENDNEQEIQEKIEEVDNKNDIEETEKTQKENRVSVNLLEGKSILSENTENYSVQKEKISLGDLDRDTKDIKTEENKEKVSKKNYAIYGLITFFVLISFLFILKKYNNIRKNEFK